MKDISKSIVLLLTGILMFSMPMMAQNGITSKELAKQEKELRKKINECENIKSENKVIKTIVFRKNPFAGERRYPELRKKYEIWHSNNEMILKNMPDILYVGSKTADMSSYYNLDLRYEYNFIPLQGSKVFPNQTISFSEMNKQGAGVLYADMTHRWDRIGNRMKKAFYQFAQINWSGDIRNGSIDGEGEGYINKDGVLYFVKGRFNSGKPEGSCAFYEFNMLNKDLRHTDVKVGSFNGGFAQITKSDEEGKVLYVDNNFSIFDIKERIAHLYYENKQKGHWGRWSQSTLKSFVDNKVVVVSTYIARDGYHDRDQILDSIRLELFMNTNGDFAGLTENGKQSICEYYNSIIPIAENLSKVFNAQEVNNPFNNLKNHYSFDIRQLKNKLITIEHLPDDIPQADSIYKANPNISDKIEIGRNLYKLYEILEMDYTNTYNKFNNLLSSSFMEEKAKDATKILDALMSNPLFPKKSQATVNVVKTKLKSMTNSYAQAWAKANKAETSKREAQNAQNRKIDELVESYDIPRVKTELFYGPAGGLLYYRYEFEDGISGLVGFRDGNKYTVDTGGKLLTVYKTIEDAKCALYFWKKYGRERRRGMLGY